MTIFGIDALSVQQLFRYGKRQLDVGGVLFGDVEKQLLDGWRVSKVRDELSDPR